MPRVTCPHCGAAFDVDFPPGTQFRCGACQGLVIVPDPGTTVPASQDLQPPEEHPEYRDEEAASRAAPGTARTEEGGAPRPSPRARAPREREGARARPGSAGRPPRERRPAGTKGGKGKARRTAKADGSSTRRNQLLILGGAGFVVLVLVIALATPSSGDDNGDGGGNPVKGGPNDPTAGTDAPDPQAEARRLLEGMLLQARREQTEENRAERRAQLRTQIAEAFQKDRIPYAVLERTRDEILRRALASKKPEDIADALVLTQVRRDSSGSERAKERLADDLVRLWRLRVAVDPDDEEAHAAMRELGWVYFSVARLEKLRTAEWASEDLKESLQFAREEAQDLFGAGRVRGWEKFEDPHWFRLGRDDFVREWLAKVEQARRERLSFEQRRANPAFISAAEREGGAIAAELSRATYPGRRDKLFQRPGVSEEIVFDVVPIMPYVFVVQKDTRKSTQGQAERWRRELEDLLRSFYSRFDELPRVTKDPSPIIVLQDRRAYDNYLTVVRGHRGPTAAIQGHYEPQTRRIVCFEDPRRAPEATRNTLFHEGTHQIMDSLRNRASNSVNMGAQSFWFDEGIAVFFGGHKDGFDPKTRLPIYVPGLIPMSRLDGLVVWKRGNTLLDFEDLLTHTRQDEWKNPAGGTRTLKFYAQGWALVFFLERWQDGKVVERGPYSEAFHRYVQAEVRGESGRSAFLKHIAGGDPSKLEKIRDEYEAMVATLVDLRQKGKISGGEIRP